MAVRLYGWTENNREVEMDMREMVDKVKKGEPLYGHSELTPYMQGVAARNSRYSALLGHVLPWMNFVNHNQVCCNGPRKQQFLDSRANMHTAWCRYSQVLSASRARAGSRKIRKSQIVKWNLIPEERTASKDARSRLALTTNVILYIC